MKQEYWAIRSKEDGELVSDGNRFSGYTLTLFSEERTAKLIVEQYPDFIEVVRVTIAI